MALLIAHTDYRCHICQHTCERLLQRLGDAVDLEDHYCHKCKITYRVTLPIVSAEIVPNRV